MSLTFLDEPLSSYMVMEILLCAALGNSQVIVSKKKNPEKRKVQENGQENISQDIISLGEFLQHSHSYNGQYTLFNLLLSV